MPLLHEHRDQKFLFHCSSRRDSSRHLLRSKTTAQVLLVTSEQTTKSLTNLNCSLYFDEDFAQTACIRFTQRDRQLSLYYLLLMDDALQMATVRSPGLQHRLTFHGSRHICTTKKKEASCFATMVVCLASRRLLEPES